MNTPIGEAFLINFHTGQDTCELGAAVILPEGYLAVAGFVGEMPAVIGHKIIHAANEAGVTVKTVVANSGGDVVALCWGDIDPKKLYGLIAVGIAESATKAIVNALAVAGADLEEIDPDGYFSASE